MHDSPDECLADRRLDDPACRADLAAFDDAGVVPEDDRAHRVLLEVEGEAEDIAPEVEELGGHAVGKAVDAGDAVSDLDHGADVDGLGFSFEAFDLRLVAVGDLWGGGDGAPPFG